MRESEAVFTDVQARVESWWRRPAFIRRLGAGAVTIALTTGIAYKYEQSQPVETCVMHESLGFSETTFIQQVLTAPDHKSIQVGFGNEGLTSQGIPIVTVNGQDVPITTPNQTSVVPVDHQYALRFVVKTAPDERTMTLRTQCEVNTAQAEH